MPLKNDVLTCINHPATRLRPEREFAERLRVPGLRWSWLMRTESAPVVMYICPRCGYVETYASGLEERRSEEADATRAYKAYSGRDVLTALDFESAVLRAIESGTPPFANAKVRTEVPLERNDRTYTIAALVELKRKLYAVEVKSAISESIIHRAVHEAIDNADAYTASLLSEGRTARPLVIVPDGAKVKRSIHNVPILRFDQSTERFIGRLQGASTNAG